MIGQLVSHYRIIEKLGEGGMGVVYRAHDTRLDRDVALKCLPQGLPANGLEQARFLQEARAAALLNHPYICTVHDVLECDGNQFIVMEHLEGKTLREKIEQGEVTYRDAINYAIQMAEALQEAHAHGVVHRDVKSENIMVTPRGQVKIMDFGLAKLKGALKLTRTSSTIGTLAYMSPEQIEGNEADARSDIFSFGVVLYEMLTGHLPFRGEHEAAVMYSIINEEPTAIRKYIPEISSELEAILTRALEKDPEGRYQQVDDMASALRRLQKTTSGVSRGGMASEPSVGKIGPALKRSIRFLSRRPPARTLIAVGLLIVAGLSYFLFSHPAATLAGNRVAVTLFENQTGDPVLQTYGTLMSESVAEGLTAIAAVDVVPVSEAIRVWEQVKSGSEHGDAIGSFARQTGTKLVITGAYYKQGDSLLIHARVTDAETGKNVKVMQAIGCTVEKRMPAINLVRQRLLGAVAFQVDVWGSSYADSPTYFPSFDAYREFKTGSDIFMRNGMAECLSHFRKSAELDPGFQAPLGWMALAYMNLNNYRAADSLIHCMDNLRSTLVTMDLTLLNWLQALFAGDNVSCLEFARAWCKRFPGQPLCTYQWGLDALKNNRPHEAIAAFSQLGPSSTTSFRDWVSTWAASTIALHLMGEHEQELEEAGKGRQTLPDRIGMIMFEMRALAALGRINEIWKKYEEACASPQMRGTAAAIMTTCARELRHHGFAEASRQAADRAITWYLSRSDSEQQSQVWQTALAQSYYVAGRFSDAQRLGRRLLQQNPEKIDCQGFVGTIAARLGDAGEARRIDGILKENRRPYLFGSHTYWRARIAALLGEKERALALLRDALSQGTSYAILHADMDLETLRDYPPFQDLVKLKD